MPPTFSTSSLSSSPPSPFLFPPSPSLSPSLPLLPPSPPLSLSSLSFSLPPFSSLTSQILLNFFAAVILDNLDYTEEKKVKKLEQELKTHKIEKVPIHLKLFKCCGPKRVRVPKLSSVDGPSLTEADVRNFYNTGETADFSRSAFHCEAHIPPNIVRRQSSELSNLELLNKDSSDVMSNGIQGKYWGIQGILNYVKAFRQHSREQEEARPQDSLGGRTTGYDYRSGVGSQLDTAP